ncbi:MAG: 2-amino-4-hydroxy-6-hydroxymethyldihydropteridine diphosphokinase [Parabacteroides sp.]|nr:2-amino-4-hydroxy-6-hydroxymethyldihydropteridine diphosphokinase [Parabacteroides sp.]
MQAKVIIGLGSNWECEEHIEAAVRLLKVYFNKIVFSDAVYTEPIGMSQPNLFLNQVAIAYTSRPMEEVRTALKSMEQQLGRTPQFKQQGIIPIDIDLLQWNDHIFKPQDLEIAYIRQGIEAISSGMLK